MARKGKITQLKAKFGDLHSVIPRMVEQFGQEEAGKKLGLSETTVNHWLRDNGYKKVIRYVREDDIAG